MQYKVIRSWRKSISVEVRPDGKVVVRAGMYYTKEDIERFVSAHEDWIKKKVKESRGVSKRFAAVMNYEAVLVDGEQIPLVIGERNELAPDALYAKYINDVPNVVYRAKRDEFLARCDEISRKCGLFPQSIGFKEYKTRWGCCDSRDNVTFSVYLMFLPIRLQEFVITHEFCHIKVKNHSYDFKALLSSLWPDWKKCQEEIKDYTFLTRLYQLPLLSPI